MKYNFTIKEINKFTAAALVHQHHYSKVMPKLTKHYLGAYLDGKLVGVLTLGWGTQPLATIRKLFPDLTTKDYYEIGKMCMLPEMPRNSETQMLSAVVRWMKENTPERMFLYTWADGIVGKVGFVYQAANFLYGGFIWTDVYIGPDGEKIHPRTSHKLCEENAIFSGKEKVFWLTKDFMKVKGITRVRGKQFRYILPLCRKAKTLLQKSTVQWTTDYPKKEDLEWKRQTDDGYVLIKDMPAFDLSKVTVNRKNVKSFEVTENQFFG